jgi:predicted transcriptional regulator
MGEENKFEFRQNISCVEEILKYLRAGDRTYKEIVSAINVNKQQLNFDLNTLQATGQIGSQMIKSQRYYFIKSNE